VAAGCLVAIHQVRHHLVAEQVEVHPALRAAALGAAQLPARVRGGDVGGSDAGMLMWASTAQGRPTHSM
jgi:hypothetical protein